MVGLVVLVAGCAALVVVLASAKDKPEPTLAGEVSATARDSQAAAQRMISLPGPGTPLESIDPDSLQSINPVYTVPRASRLHGRLGKRWAQQHMIGLSFRQADELAAPRGMSVRIIEIDGRPMFRHDDRITARINVALAAGRIVRIDGMY